MLVSASNRVVLSASVTANIGQQPLTEHIKLHERTKINETFSQIIIGAMSHFSVCAH